MIIIISNYCDRSSPAHEYTLCGKPPKVSQADDTEVFMDEHANGQELIKHTTSLSSQYYIGIWSKRPWRVAPAKASCSQVRCKIPKLLSTFHFMSSIHDIATPSGFEDWSKAGEV